MNLSLERISLIASVLVNLFLASSVLYQNRGIIRSDDPRFPGVISQLESKLKQLDGRVSKTTQEYEAAAKSQLDTILSKAEEAGKATQAQIKALEQKAKAYYDKTDKLESAGAKADKAMHYVEDQLKKLVK